MKQYQKAFLKTNLTEKIALRMELGRLAANRAARAKIRNRCFGTNSCDCPRCR